MLRSRGMHLDMRQVERRMRLLNIVIMPKRIRIGLTAAGNRFMIDCIVGQPTMPIHRPQYKEQDRRAGELRASGALFVDMAKMRTTQHYGESAMGKYQPDSYGGTPIPKFSHEACVVFNAPYAAEQETQRPSKTEPGAGMHFMSKKLYGNGVQYMGIMARAMKL